jgi:hypothetical protein
MPITNDTELWEAVKGAGDLLQQIEDYLHGQPHRQGAVRFPRKLIRPAKDHRIRLSFVSDPDLRTNLAYTLILTDVVRWVLVRTDLSGTAREMLVKQLVFLAGTLVESITKDYLKGLCGQSYEKRTAFLVANGVIDAGLKAELDWLWDLRNKMHLYGLDEAEYVNDYNNKTLQRAVAAYQTLVDALRARRRLTGRSIRTAIGKKTPL